jgi:hypothetical protein
MGKKMSYKFSMQDAFDFASKKIAIDGWNSYAIEVMDGGYLVTGCVPDGVYSRGRRKGEPRYSKHMDGTNRKVVVSFSELVGAAMEREASTGNCWNCGGKGKVVVSWDHLSGVGYKPCKRCGGSGLAPGEG